MELSEIERTADVTDAALAQLGMSALTDTPEAVTGALKELPAALAGAEITWTSSDTDVISNDGQSVVSPKTGDQDVIMTAGVRNPADGFTQYADFRVTVKGEEGTVIISEDYTNGSVSAAALSNLGWRVMPSGDEYEQSTYGTFKVDAADGLTIQKTTHAIATPPVYKPSYRMQRIFTQRIPEYLGNERMTVRGENFKGIYDIQMETAYTVTAGNLMQYFNMFFAVKYEQAVKNRGNWKNNLEKFKLHR